MTMANNKAGWARRIYHWTLIHGSRVRAIWLLALASVGDFFIPALPTQSSVILLALLQPQHSRLIVLGFTVAAAMGAGILAIFISLVAPVIHDMPFAWHFAGFQLDLKQLVQQWGSAMLFALSLLPTPPRLAVITALSLGLPWYEVVLAVAAGKWVWFSLVVWLTRQAPDKLKRIPIIGKNIIQLAQHQQRIHRDS
ncbi:hypothetical protein ACTSKR_13875 [Chitinibacteraceae bacterium HSL-7]